MTQPELTFKQQLVIRILCVISRMMLSRYDSAAKPMVELLEKLPADLKEAVKKDSQS